MQRGAQEQTRYLRLIRWSHIPIVIAVVTIFCALLFGWLKIDFVYGPIG